MVIYQVELEISFCFLTHVRMFTLVEAINFTIKRSTLGYPFDPTPTRYFNGGFFINGVPFCSSPQTGTRKYCARFFKLAFFLTSECTSFNGAAAEKVIISYHDDVTEFIIPHHHRSPNTLFPVLCNCAGVCVVKAHPANIRNPTRCFL